MHSTKKALREMIRQRLAAVTDRQRAERSSQIADRVLALPAWRDARVVMPYLSLPGEVQTRSLVETAWAEGKVVAVPRVDWGRRRMSAVRVRSWSDEFVTGRHGLVEPASGEAVDIATIDLVLVPGLAFDADGSRLGRGGGFFDRFLSQPGFRGVTCGLAFDCQRVEHLPADAADIGVDLLVSESAVRAFSERGRRAADPATP